MRAKSLGFLGDAVVPTRAPRVTVDAPSPRVPEVPKRVRWCVCVIRPCSLLAILSFASLSSIASTCGIASIGGLVSLCSALAVASAFSVLSVASLLSVASTTSVLSIAAEDCTLGVYEKCRPAMLHSIQTELSLHFTSETWDEMASCSKQEYKSVNRPSKCDYKQITCTFHNLTTGYNVTDACQIRRKGSSTWRDLLDKPSFKIKKFGDVDFGEFECHGNCPQGESSNKWATNKVTLQNQVVADGEIDAYNLFRKHIAAPLAVQTRVRLFKDALPVREDAYVMLEAIDDNKFLRKWFGGTAVLYELDDDSNPHTAKFERYIEENDEISSLYVDAPCNSTSDACDDLAEEATESELSSPNNLKRVLNLGLQDFDARNVMHYYAGEVVTNHWDAVCSEYASNTYIVFNGSAHFYVPSGTDETFQCPTRRKIVGWSSSRPRCRSMRQCYDTETCRREYDDILTKVDESKERDAYDACPNLTATLTTSILSPIGVTLFFVLARRWKK